MFFKNELCSQYSLFSPSGKVPLEPERVELADGEPVMTRTYPTMALDVECGKNTDFNYGPWADRQR